jgi:hypothetical protein
MLHSGSIPGFVEINTPAGVALRLKVEHPVLEDGYASCGLSKTPAPTRM